MAGPSLNTSLELRYRGWLICLAGFALAGLFLIPTRSEIDPDLFYLLAYGRLTADLGALPVRDLFAFTPTKSIWIEHQWLTGVLLQFVVSLFGDRGLLFLKVSIAITALCCLRSAQRVLLPQAGVHSLLLLIVLFLLHPAWFGNLRGLTFSALFFSIEIWLAVQWIRRQKKGALLCAPFLFLLWSNMHAEHVIGVACWVAICYTPALFQLVRPTQSGAAGSATRRAPALSCNEVCLISLSVLLCFVAIVANPWGMRFYTDYLLPTAGICAQGEHLADCRGPFSQAVLFIPLLLLLAAPVLAKKRRALEAGLISLLLITAVLALRMERLQGYFFLSSAVLLPAWLSIEGLPSVIRRWATGPARGAAVSIGMLVVAGMGNLLWNLPGLLRNNVFSFCSYPVKASEILANLAAAAESDAALDAVYKIVTPFDIGNYVHWRLAPTFKVSLDGRYVNVYQEEVLPELNRAGLPLATGHGEAVRKLDPDFTIFPAAVFPNSLSIKQEEEASGLGHCLSAAGYHVFCRPSLAARLSATMARRQLVGEQDRRGCFRPRW